MNFEDFEQNIEQWLTNGAVMSFTPGQLLLGWGKRQSTLPTQAQPKISFYFPDFFLKDPSPWFQYEYTQTIKIDSLLQILTLKKNGLSHCYYSPTYTWKNDYNPLFCRTFKELKQQMAAGELDKAVPFVFETSPATVTISQLIFSLCNMLKYMQEYPVYLYGFWNQVEGMLGLTPEILFRYSAEQRLETMACAGTSRKDADCHQFLSDPKQINEHQWVVKGIAEALTPFGKLRIGERQLLSLPNINHLVTPISVDLDSPPDFESIVKALHPTPALGAFPRAPGMRWLESYQQHIDRRRFGAPVAFLKDDGTAGCYVAIRNVQWDQRGMLVGAGCGIVPASQCDNEWAEINLKLKATKEMLGVL